MYVLCTGWFLLSSDVVYECLGVLCAFFCVRLCDLMCVCEGCMILYVVCLMCVRCVYDVSMAFLWFCCSCV